MSAASERSRNAAAAPGLVLAVVALAASAAAQSPERLADGIALKLGERRLELRVCREDLVRVVDAAPGSFFARRSLVTVADACQPTAFEVKPGAVGVDVTTKRLTARIALPSGAVTFLDRGGRTLLAERPGGRTLAPAEVMGEKTFHVRTEFQPQAGEALYGLGAHQNGWMNYAGRDVDLYQHNIVDVVPFLASSPRLRPLVGQHVAHEVR